jgi:hypothetical protein
VGTLAEIVNYIIIILFLVKLINLFDDFIVQCLLTYYYASFCYKYFVQWPHIFHFGQMQVIAIKF